MESAQSNTTRWWQVTDRIGATASFLCAIHCALLPFVLTLLPLAGLDFLASHTFERVFVLFAAALALFSLVNGFRRHRRVHALILAGAGLVLLLSGVTFAESYSLVVHSTLVTCGGLMVASAHFLNLFNDRRRAHVHSAVCAH